MKRLTSNIVPPVGPLDAEICFIGELPGGEEDRLCQPFMGSGGQLLNRCLGKVGILRGRVLLRNVFLQKTPNGKVDHYYQDKGKKLLTLEGQEHVGKLRMWLERLQRERGGGPKVLVALGAEPMKILTGKRRITKWRGSILPCVLVPGYKVYCCFHPSYVNRLMNEVEEKKSEGEKKKNAQNVLPLFLIDLDRVKMESEFREIRRVERQFHTSLGFTQLKEALKKLNSAEYWEGKEPYLAVDIETLPGNTGPLLWCVGFAPTPEVAFVVPFIRRQQSCWRLEEEAELLILISRIFLNPRIEKVFQGGAYDLSVLGKYYGLRVARGTYADTMLCHHASYPYIRKGLEVLCSIYTREPYYKDEGKVNLGKRTDEAEFRYNCKDCCCTREIYPTTVRNAKELGTWEGYLRTMSIFPSHLGMMIRGVRLDVERQRELGRIFEEKARKAQLSVNKFAGVTINLNSNPDKQRFLYGLLGLPFQYHLKTGKPTTDKDALSKLKKKFPKQPMLQHVIDYQKYSKLVSTYTSMKSDRDGRVHTSYSFVSTWRTNSSSSHFGSPVKGEKEGGNLQNIPKRSKEGKLIRKLFIPDEGFEMGRADYSQAEARVVAWEANDIPSIHFFEEGKDIHWKGARELFGIPSSLEYSPDALFRDSITEEEHTHSEYRDIGKTVIHATNYGMGPIKMQSILALQGFHLELKVCKRLLSKSKTSNPFRSEWQRKIREEIKATRTLTSSFNRTRKFMGRFNDALFRAAYAFSPQNTVGELLQRAIQNVWEQVPKAHILLNVHDEVDWQHRPEDRDEVMEGVKRAMTIPLTIHGRELIIPVEREFGPSWGEMEEYS